MASWRREKGPQSCRLRKNAPPPVAAPQEARRHVGRVGLLDADIHGPSLPSLVALPDGTLPLVQDGASKLIQPAQVRAQMEQKEHTPFTFDPNARSADRCSIDQPLPVLDHAVTLDELPAGYVPPQLDE